VENRNQACYTEELAYCTQLITALEYIVRVMEDHPSRYPPLMSDVVCLIYGRKVVVNGNPYMINGLKDQIDELYETLEALELEVLFEGGSDEGEMQGLR
jgi:hypothetical protein